MILLMVGVLKYFQPAEHRTYEPLAVAAQNTAPQPCIAIAKQGKAAVVRISRVKNRTRGTTDFGPFFDDPSRTYLAHRTGLRSETHSFVIAAESRTNRKQLRSVFRNRLAC